MNEILKRSNEKFLNYMVNILVKIRKTWKYKCISINSKDISKLLANFVLLKDYYESIVPNIKICEKLYSTQKTTTMLLPYKCQIQNSFARF